MEQHRGREGERHRRPNDAARRAARMEPWNAAFLRRATVMREWARGADLLGNGDLSLAASVARQRRMEADINEAERLGPALSRLIDSTRRQSANFI